MSHASSERAQAHKLSSGSAPIERQPHPIDAVRHRASLLVPLVPPVPAGLPTSHDPHRLRTRRSPRVEPVLHAAQHGDPVRVHSHRVRPPSTRRRRGRRGSRTSRWHRAASMGAFEVTLQVPPLRQRTRAVGGQVPNLGPRASIHLQPPASRFYGSGQPARQRSRGSPSAGLPNAVSLDDGREAMVREVQTPE
jgi:hypothetical protein